MKKNNVFLTAEWKNLIMANYLVKPSVLEKYLPAHTEIDTWNDNCYVSVVGFVFDNVRVKGIRVPFHTQFPEANLRFYVREKKEQGYKRGVVFIKEIVPKPAITAVANLLYKEHYETMPMKWLFENKDGAMYIDYKWKKSGSWNSLAVLANPVSFPLKEGSEEEFITEHFWGYTRVSKNKTAVYEVSHPRWNIHPIKSYTITCDFEEIYGTDFAFLNKTKPVSVFMAVGSAIEVFRKQDLSKSS